MKNKIYCPVCQIKFLYREPAKEGMAVICPICGAKLEITGPAAQEEIPARKYPESPEEEIRGRVDTYAGLKGYVFNEDKELVMEGLLEKKEKYGDFFCPCRIENVAENVCPCLKTRQNDVKKEGHCF